MEEQSIKELQHDIKVLEANFMSQLNELSSKFNHQVYFQGSILPVISKEFSDRAERLLGYHVDIEAKIKP